MIALWGALLLVDLPGSSPVCLPPAARDGPGVPDPFRPPDPKATELNAEGKLFYRQGKWAAARERYRAAEAADPAFLAPRLNVACSFVRQERFGEAVEEVRALLDRAYVPWAREVLEAADLGALKVQPQMAEVRRAMAAAAVRWGAGLDESLIFVARQRTPLRIPATGAGEFILNPHQEVYAFSPATARFRQLTAEDGHVLAVARAPDRRRIVYVTGEKLVRGAKPGDVVLEGVALHELTLATLTAGPAIPIPGPVSRIEIAATSRGLLFRIDGARVSGRFMISAGDTLLPLSGSKGPPPIAVLSAKGALPTSSSVEVSGGRACGIAARDIDRPSGGRAIVLHAHDRTAREIGSTLGAGLVGLPIP
jgi:hypothetical protein